MAIKPHRPRELALVISLVGLGISVPGAALAAQDVPFGADTGDAQQSSPLQPEFDRQPIAAAIERAYGDADREPSNADVWRVPMSSALPDEAVLEAFAARMARLPMISYLGVVVDALPEDHTLVAMRPAPLAEGPGTARSNHPQRLSSIGEQRMNEPMGESDWSKGEIHRPTGS